MKIFTYTRVVTAGIACCLSCSMLQAQENNFDLSSQRSESQNVSPVPGKKVDHNGIVLNPTPHQMNLMNNGCLDLSKNFTIKDKKHKFGDAVTFLNVATKGNKLTIDFGRKLAVKNHIRPISGAYLLKIDKKGVEIIGYDERGAFYGLQTLRQLLESEVADKGSLPYLLINDYPDLLNRGVVEGFYGTPWSHEVRLSLIDFYGKNKMDTYIYGPKDDPYHSSPNWRLPYPHKEEQNIRELIKACKKNYVNFVWAIHPGQDIKWNEEDYQNLLKKFNVMYDLGVRDFAIFFDDISGEGTNPLKQTDLLNKLTKDFVQKKGDVAPLSVCPTDYSKLWANPTENGSLAIYGKTLNPEIKVFWTGDVVCSDLTKSTADWVNSRIKRPNYFWWNFPVTDYVRHILLQGPVYGLDTQLSDKDVCGVVSNPMEHGEASKLALYGAADYTWNMKDYNALDNWERGLAYLMPHAADAYRTFAIHSADTENGYRRDESWETKTFSLKNWNEKDADALEKEFEKVEKTPSIIENGCQNKALVQELHPWLVEFGKLGKRGVRTIELMRLYQQEGNPSLFWQNYIANIMSDSDRKAYNAHKSGTMKLQPFYENGMDDMAHGFLERVSGTTPKDYRGIGSFSSAYTPAIKQMLDSDSTTYYTSGIAQKDGDWIGVDLRAPRDLKEIHILQGRNSKDDVDFFDHAILECSLDGRNWQPLIEDLKNQYVINWKGEGLKARYVRLRRLDSKRRNYAAVRIFDVNPVTLENLPYKVETSLTKNVGYAFDGNINTLYALDGTMNLEVLKGVKSYILLMKKMQSPLKCTQFDRKGKVIATSELTTPYATILVASDKVQRIQLSGKAEIYEIIDKK